MRIFVTSYFALESNHEGIEPFHYLNIDETEPPEVRGSLVNGFKNSVLSLDFCVVPNRLQPIRR